MKEKITIISDDLNHGIINEKEAKDKLFTLLEISQGSRPARAYVVSKDITTQQELDRNTQGNSSLG